MACTPRLAVLATPSRLPGQDCKGRINAVALGSAQPAESLWGMPRRICSQPTPCRACLPHRTPLSPPSDLRAVPWLQLYVVGAEDDVEAIKEEVMEDMTDIFSSVDKSGEHAEHAAPAVWAATRVARHRGRPWSAWLGRHIGVAGSGARKRLGAA